MRQDQIENALTYARRGYHIFPAIWRQKTKQHQGLCKWSTESTTNPDVIKTWGAMHPDKSYFCVALRQSNRTVIDIDTKNGKPGLDTLEWLQLEHGDLPETLKVQTPSGGFHFIFHGQANFGANRLGPGVDIPVMVPLPNSIVPGKGTYTTIDLLDDAPLPQWITTLTGQPDEPKETPQKPLIEEDQEHNIEKAIQYLKSAEPATEGEGGNDRTYRVLCNARDFGLSKAVCLSLVNEHYNHKCEPPWSNPELIRLIDHAYRYAKSAPGALDPSQDFEPITPEDLIQFSSFTDLTQDIVPPNWLIKNYLEKETITLFYGDSGAYKSFLVIDIGLHIAAGLSWIGRKTAKGPVFYLAGEGHGGIKRRLRAWKDYKEMDWKLPFFVSPQAIPLDKGGSVKHLITSIKAYKELPALVVVDTLATSFGSGDENSTKDMNTFLNHVQALRQALGCAVIVVHHTGHLAKERPRGAYALMAGVDAYYNIEKTESGLTCLCSPGKMKDATPVKDTWFKTKSVKIGVDEDLEDITSLVVEWQKNYQPPVGEKGLGTNQNMVLAILTDLGEQSLAPLREEFKAKKLESGRQYSRQSFHKAVKSLEFKELVKVENGVLRDLRGLESEI